MGRGTCSARRLYIWTRGSSRAERSTSGDIHFGEKTGGFCQCLVGSHSCLGSSSQDDVQGYGYGDVQRMQAPQPDMWEQQSAAQQPQSVPSPSTPPPLPSQEDEFVGGSSQSFFGEMPPRGAVRHLCLRSLNSWHMHSLTSQHLRQHSQRAEASDSSRAPLHASSHFGSSLV